MPECPPELMYLWHWFRRLSSRRQIGMDVNPISYEAVTQFAKLNQIDIHAWELAALERLDEAVMAVWRTGRVKAKAAVQEINEDGLIPAGNVEGVRQFMQGLKARQAAKLAIKKQGWSTDV